MTAIRKTITVTDAQNEWIKSQVSSGRYTNDSEYIRTLVREHEAREAHNEEIRQALKIGMESGGFLPFDAEDFKARMKARHG